MEREILKIKTYTIEEIHYSDGGVVMNRKCEGFNAIELLGIMELASRQISAGFEPKEYEEINIDGNWGKRTISHQ